MDTSDIDATGISFKQATLKRIFDFCLSFVGLWLTWWLILLAWLVASFDTRSNGLFIQMRVGRNGALFKVLKIKTMREIGENYTTVTQRGDPRITHLGSFFRKTKIDELPQLWNILCGEMSFVGPRPDVTGFADNLKGEERACSLFVLALQVLQLWLIEMKKSCWHSKVIQKHIIEKLSGQIKCF